MVQILHVTTLATRRLTLITELAAKFAKALKLVRVVW
jgi:hypothetical protein